MPFPLCYNYFMSDKLSKEKNLTFSINDSSHHEDISLFGKALSSPERLKILETLQEKPKYLIEISKELDIPISSVSRHIDILAQAQLIFISYEPGLKGHSKLCSKAVLGMNISFEDRAMPGSADDSFITEMPVGMFTECKITSPCGMVGAEAAIGKFDDPGMFFSAERADAELLWFNTGYISYMFPVQKNRPAAFSELTFSFEICSETVYHRNKWPSDITVMVNDKEITTFTSPGDFGGRRGKYTPEFWPAISTQFGLLMKFSINATGVYINNVLKTDTPAIQDLRIDGDDSVKLTLAIKDDATHKGGMNLFGKNFGDYPQAIIMTLK